MPCRRPRPAQNCRAGRRTGCSNHPKVSTRCANCQTVPPSGFSGCDHGRTLRSQTPLTGSKGAAGHALRSGAGRLAAGTALAEWILRVEAVIFASAEPVGRETLARVVGKDCGIDLLIDDPREEFSPGPASWCGLPVAGSTAPGRALPRRSGLRRRRQAKG